MPIFNYKVQINASPDKVFAYITEFQNHAAWYEYAWRVETVSGGETRLGSQFRSVGDDPFGKQTPNEITVTEFEAPARFCFQCTDPRFPNPTLNEFTLKEQAGGTLLQRTFTSNPGFPFNLIFSLILEPFQGRPSMLRSMNKIKAHLEASA